MKDRNQRIRRMVFQGKLTLAEIGKLFSGTNGKPLSRQRIHQIAFNSRNSYS